MSRILHRTHHGIFPGGGVLLGLEFGERPTGISSACGIPDAGATHTPSSVVKEVAAGFYEKVHSYPLRRITVV